MGVLSFKIYIHSHSRSGSRGPIPHDIGLNIGHNPMLLLFLLLQDHLEAPSILLINQICGAARTLLEQYSRDENNF